MGKILLSKNNPWVLRFTCVLWLSVALLTPALAEVPRKRKDDGLFDQLKIVLSTRDSVDRQVALTKIDNQNLFRVLACSESDLELAYLATALLTNQEDLKNQAVSSRALIRLAAVRFINDEQFLLARILGRDEPSLVVRRAIVGTLKDLSLLVRAAETAYYQDVRVTAGRRVMDPELAVKVQAAKAVVEAQVVAVEHTEQPRDLLPYLTDAKYDVISMAAAKALEDQETLALAVMLRCDYAVKKVLLKKLTDRDLLKKLAAEASDPALRLAAEARYTSQVMVKAIDKIEAALHSIDRLSVGEIRKRKKEYDGEILKLVDVAGALALTAGNVGHHHVKVNLVCVRLLKYEYAVSELADLFEIYGGTDLARQYLISGQPELEESAYRWYEKHGYDIKKLDGPLKMRW